MIILDSKSRLSIRVLEVRCSPLFTYCTYYWEVYLMCKLDLDEFYFSLAGRDLSF